MRSLFTLLTLGFAVLSFNTQAIADGLVYQLPEDGTSAEFDLKFSGPGKQGTGSLTVSSVGKVKEDGKACRWIEFNIVMTLNDMERRMVAKVLIPETEFAPGKKPFENRVRAWIRLGESPDAKNLEQNDFGPLPVFLSGPFENAKKLDAIEVETKALGKLKCEGASGLVKTEDRRKNETTIETRLNKKAPFGVVSCKMEMKAERNGEFVPEVEITLTLKKVGKDAKSLLPDSK
jgi:hypothetical protein